MCASSVIGDYYMRTWPERNPTTPNIFQTADPVTLDLLRKAIGILEKIDARLGDVECMDEQKAAFMDGLKKKRPVAKGARK